MSVNISLSELLSLVGQFNSRIDVLWQRTIYSHAAIVGVMIFFGTTDDQFVLARFVVFGFYTVNLIITAVNFNEAYSGLNAAILDIRNHHSDQSELAVFKWSSSRLYTFQSRMRYVIFSTFWISIGFILFYPLVS